MLADAERGDTAASAAVQAIGQWLGLGCASLVNIFNPELVVLGGFFCKLYPLVEMALREQIRTRAVAPARNFVNIVPAMLGPDAAVLGAAELALEPILTDPTIVPARPEALSRTEQHGKSRT